MTKTKYVKLKHLTKLIEKYPDAILAYPVDSSKFDYSYRLVGEVHEDHIDMHPDYVGPGSPKSRLVLMVL